MNILRLSETISYCVNFAFWNDTIVDEYCKGIIRDVKSGLIDVEGVCLLTF